jgi:hypothetical protein
MKSGTMDINTSSAFTSGISGGAARFLGRTNYQWVDLGTDRPFINNKSEVTISVWMNADADIFESKDLISFSRGGSTINADNPESRARIGVTGNRFLLSFCPSDTVGSTWIRSTGSFVPKQWYHITGVLKVPQDSLYLYVNGELWGAATAPFKAAATSSTNSIKSTIGANDFGIDDYFYGIIDEARIEDRARSLDWIKLCYMNQKTVDGLIK